MTDKDKELPPKASLKWILGFAVVELALIALVVWIFDPFYQYHGPFFGMNAVLNDRDNQMAGTIHNFQYDSLLVGSSVAENFDTAWLDAEYECNAIKVIRASGSMADLLYYVEMAEQEQEIDNIFWCLDLFALDAAPEVTLYDKDVPRYLHTKTILDDVPYLYNKEILLEKIPVMMVSSARAIHTGGQAYNWAEGKSFGAESAMRVYNRDRSMAENRPRMLPEEYVDTVHQNVAMLSAQISVHPEIQYRFLVPPYSLLWWDCAWVNGQDEEKFFILEEVIPALLNFENVELYYFQNEESIVCNLDYYMDMVHYSPAINQFMLEQMREGDHRLTKENWQEKVEEMRSLLWQIYSEEIYRYYG